MDNNAVAKQGPYSTTRILDVPYGEADGLPLLLDIVRPDPVPDAPMPDAPMPVVVDIHGGGWMQHEKRTDRNEFLAAHGFFTVSINYRLSQEAPFPAQIHDAKAAVRWCRLNALNYHLDPERIGVWGESAGGHLAELLGVSGDVPELEGGSGSGGLASRVQAVFAIAGVSDFLRPGDFNVDAPDVPEALLLGGSVREYEQLARVASPISYVHPGVSLPPFFLLHGDRDDTVPIGQSESLYRALRAVGADATFVLVPGADHRLAGAYVTDLGDYWPLIASHALDFFVRRLGLGN